MTWLRFDATLDGATRRNDICVKIRDDVIERVLPLSELADGIQMRHIPAAITPGLFDIQVNGGGGVMFNNDDAGWHSQDRRCAPPRGHPIYPAHGDHGSA